MSAVLPALLAHLSKTHHTLQATKQLHSLVFLSNLFNNPFYATRLVRLYSINGDLATARQLFDVCRQRSVYLWNSIIRAYAQVGKFDESFSLFSEMQRSEIRPCNYTFACVARACTEEFNLDGLRSVQGGLTVAGYGLDIVCCSALVVGYAKMGMVGVARLVFDGVRCPDLVLWNSMISAYGSVGMWEVGLGLFGRMRRLGEMPDRYTLVGILSSLEDEMLLVIGEAVHCYCLKGSFDSSDHVASVLVSMYTRCMCLVSAFKLFRGLHQPDLVTRSALITGFSQSGECEKALCLFREMNVEAKRADHLLVASVVAACAKLASLKSGSEMHGFIVRHGYESEVMVTSALVDLYSKCGLVHLGARVFDTMPNRNTVSYNSLILGLGLHGLATGSFELFEELKREGLQPDESTFSALLCTCCHSGLVKDGREIFKRMSIEFGIQPRTEHYVYFVKLIGMAGRLEEAYDLILTLPMPVDCSIWGALLSCCEVLGNSKLAEIAAHKIMESKPEKHVYDIMLCNIYSREGRWDDARKLRENVDCSLAFLLLCNDQVFLKDQIRQHPLAQDTLGVSIRLSASTEGSVKSVTMASSGSFNSPCACCKFLKRKCLPDCIFAPYFPPQDPHKFINIHKIFGANNVSKLLHELPPHQRSDAVKSMAYEATARIRDPVHGCVAEIYSLQQQAQRLQKEIQSATAQLRNYETFNSYPYSLPWDG
ncbi:unnamed protein product [Rhodiola kirilowii]